MSPLVRRYAADRGFPIVSVRQPQHLFVPNGRRLSRCAEPCDPWQATVQTELLGDTFYGIGATPDDAVIAAIPRGLSISLRLCEIAVDNLRDCLQEVTSNARKGPIR